MKTLYIIKNDIDMNLFIIIYNKIFLASNKILFNLYKNYNYLSYIINKTKIKIYEIVLLLNTVHHIENNIYKNCIISYHGPIYIYIFIINIP